jgi:hypothetical protein
MIPVQRALECSGTAAPPAADEARSPGLARCRPNALSKCPRSRRDGVREGTLRHSIRCFRGGQTEI